MNTTNELGKRLRSQLAAQKDKYPKQQSLAAQWALDWKKQHGEDCKTAAVESRLSELLNGKLEGVKFFFGDPARSRLLFDLLELPSEARAECARNADSALSDRVDVRLAIDLRGLDRLDFKSACDWLENEILRGERRQLLPVQMLVTDEQLDDIPRRFDPHKAARLVTWPEVKATDPAVAPTARMLLAPDPGGMARDEGAWPWERWVQFKVKDGAVVLDPKDGLDRLQEDGLVARFAAPRALLTDLGFVPDAVAAKHWLAKQRGMWRTTAEMLLTGAKQEAPELRLALAKQFGLAAPATELEVSEHEIAHDLEVLGVKGLAPMKQGELDRLLVRAKSRPVSGKVVRVGDQLHTINLDLPPGLSLYRVTPHQVWCPEPAIDALRTAVSRLTLDDLEDDPGLDHLVEALVTAGQVRQAVEHARAALCLQTKLWVDLPKLLAPARAIGDLTWRQALVNLLSRPLASVALVVKNSEFAVAGKAPVGRLAVPTVTGSFAVTSAAATKLSKCGQPNHEEHWDIPSVWSYFWQALRDLPANTDVWLDAYDQWCIRRKDDFDRHIEPVGPFTWADAMSVHPPFEWADLQALCGALLIRLSEAERVGQAVTMPDEASIIPIGGGLAARLTFTRRIKDLDGIRVLVPGRLDGHVAAVDWTVVNTCHGAAVCGPRLPTEVVIDSGTLRLRMTFHADPFTAGLAATPLGIGAAALGAKARLDGEARMDDDD